MSDFQCKPLINSFNTYSTKNKTHNTFSNMDIYKGTMSLLLDLSKSYVIKTFV